MALKQMIPRSVERNVTRTGDQPKILSLEKAIRKRQGIIAKNKVKASKITPMQSAMASSPGSKEPSWKDANRITRKTGPIPMTVKKRVLRPFFDQSKQLLGL